MSFGMAILLIGFVWGIAPMILKQIGLENVVAQIAIRYLYFLSLGILPLLLF